MDAELRLDGNAVAGLLSEVLAGDPTMIELRCAGCGAEDVVGRVLVYNRGPGTVLRCPACSAVLLRLVEARGQVRVDMRGVALLTQRQP